MEISQIKSKPDKVLCSQITKQEICFSLGTVFDKMHNGLVQGLKIKHSSRSYSLTKHGHSVMRGIPV